MLFKKKKNVTINNPTIKLQEGKVTELSDIGRTLSDGRMCFKSESHVKFVSAVFMRAQADTKNKKTQFQSEICFELLVS